MFKKLKRWIRVGVVTACCAVNCMTSHAFTIRSIQIEGLEVVSELSHRGPLETLYLNETYTPVIGREIMQTLLATGQFKSISLQQEGDVLKISCVEKTRVESLEVNFSGRYGEFIKNQLQLEERLKANCQLAKDDAFSEETIEIASRYVKNTLAQSGFYHVTYAFETVPVAKDRVKVILKGEANEIANIKAVKFVGNRKIASDRLLEQLEFVAPSEFTRLFKQALDRVVHQLVGKSPVDTLFLGDVLNTLSRETRRLEEYYRSQGYLDVKIGIPKLQLSKDFTGVDLIYSIEEGEPYRIASIKIQCDGPEADRKQWIDEFKRLSVLDVSDVFDDQKLAKHCEQIRSALKEQGYWNCQVRGEAREKNQKQHTVAVQIECLPGNKFYVRSIKFFNPHFVRESVLRKLMTLTEGSLFTQKSWRKDRGTFDALESVSVDYSRESEAVRIVNDYEVDLCVFLNDTNSFDLFKVFRSFDFTDAKLNLDGGVPCYNVLGFGRDFHVDGKLVLAPQIKGFLENSACFGNAYIEDAVSFGPDWKYRLGVFKDVRVDPAEERAQDLSVMGHAQYYTRDPYNFWANFKRHDDLLGWSLNCEFKCHPERNCFFRKGSLQYWLIAQRGNGSFDDLSNWLPPESEEAKKAYQKTGFLQTRGLYLNPFIRYQMPFRASSTSGFPQRYGYIHCGLDAGLFGGFTKDFKLAKDSTIWGNDSVAIQKNVLQIAGVRYAPATWLQRGRKYREEDLCIFGLKASFTMAVGRRGWLPCAPSWSGALTASDLHFCDPTGYSKSMMGAKSWNILSTETQENQQGRFAISGECPLGQTFLFNLNTSLALPARYMPRQLVRKARPSFFFDLKIGGNVWGLSKDELKSLDDTLQNNRWTNLQDRGTQKSWQISENQPEKLGQYLGLGVWNSLEVLPSFGIKIDFYIPYLRGIGSNDRFSCFVGLPLFLPTKLRFGTQSAALSPTPMVPYGWSRGSNWM